MTGTPRYQTNCYINTAVEVNRNQELFKNCWDFFKWLETNGICTEIARNNGNNATYTPAVGTDFWDDANPFGAQAWAVFRMDSNGNRALPYYVFFAWSGQAAGSFSSGTNDPARLRATATFDNAFGFQMAYAFDSSGDPDTPWPAAAIGSMGSDVKQDPVWAIPAGGKLYVLPISNNVGGSHATKRENCVGIMGTNSIISEIRMHMVADDDNIAIFANHGDGTVLTTCILMGRYIPIDDLVPDAPLFMMSSKLTSIGADDLNFGTLTGNNAREGGVTVLDDDTSDAARNQYDTPMMDDNAPNTAISPAKHLLYPVVLQRTTQGQVGWLDPDFFSSVYNRVHRDVVTGGAQAIIAFTASSASPKIIIPWDGSTMGDGFTRAGVQS